MACPYRLCRRMCALFLRGFMKVQIPVFGILLASCLFLGCEAAIGDSCKSSNDCPSGTVCDTDSPSGYCLVSGCDTDEECPDGSTCVQFTKALHYCLKTCKKNGDCRGRYTCRDDIGERKFCYVEPDAVYGRDDSNRVDFEISASADAGSENPKDENSESSSESSEEE